MKKMKPEALDHVAYRLKLLAEPMRLRILYHLQEGEKSVQELVALTDSGQANVSKHLSMLASSNVVGRKKKGLHVYYYIADKSIFQICDLVCKNLELNARKVSDVFQ
jgi:DNA-binding transcriptional ArsR family regulator